MTPKDPHPKQNLDEWKSEQKRIQNQTIDEWVSDYEGVEPAGPKTQTVAEAPYKNWMHETPRTRINSQPINGLILRYDTHRTTKNGAVVLVFFVVATGEEAVLFFNADNRKQRGKEKGENYKSGHMGQFNPKPRSKFRKFWMSVVGEAPSRWSLAHKFLKPRLKDLFFTGSLVTEYSISKAGRKPYLKIMGLREIESFMYKVGTD